ncbi:hypothetical protein CPC08DRAFT_708788 [Agrocybe pediades]|nr:hypothetical protein CPC08DRAFT_708788 [Agrocybe pediades]
MSSAVGLRNISFDDRDVSLKYQGSWFNTGTYNATSVHQSGTLSSTNSVGASVTFTFPQPAVAFYYYGIKRSRGGNYSICVDCDPNNRVFLNIDGVNSTDDGQNPPVVLFSTAFPTPGVHEIILVNDEDSRFPGGNSQITVDRFDLEIVDPNAVPTPSPSPVDHPTSTISSAGPSTTSSTNTSTTSTSSSSTSAAIGSLPSVGSTDPSASLPTSSLPSVPTVSSPTSSISTPFLPPSPPATRSSAPIGMIVGAVIGGLAALLVSVIILLWMRMKRGRTTPSRVRHQEETHLRQPFNPEGSFQSPGEKSSASRGGARIYPSIWTPPSSSSNSSGKLSSSASRSRAGVTHPPPQTQAIPSSRRRAEDAGPVPLHMREEESEDILPPEYSDVFNTS